LACICSSVGRQHVQEEFVARFEEPALPTIIAGAMRDWPAMSLWSVDVGVLVWMFVMLAEAEEAIRQCALQVWRG
jgi:hypothetical protein